jgi:hypothetical protein
VTDNLTGLIWLKNANCFGERIWADALSDCNALASGSCDLSDGSSAGDWCLPNVKELLSLIHYGVYNPALPNTAGTGKLTEGNPFSGVQSEYYWSSTTIASVTSYALIVDVFSVVVSANPKADTYLVWPVRAGN